MYLKDIDGSQLWKFKINDIFPVFSANMINLELNTLGLGQATLWQKSKIFERNTSKKENTFKLL